MISIDIQSALAKIKKANVTVLPDFYLDIIVNPQMSYEQLMAGISDVYTRGGGNLLGPSIQFVSGGNAGNVAKILAGLGVSTTFITETSPLGKNLIEFFMHPLGVNTIITDTGDMASSMILEIPYGSSKNNVMVNSTGSVEDFSSTKLTQKQWDIMKKSDAIAITNAHNLKMEELVEVILQKTPDNVKISIDFSDLTPHIDRINEIWKRVLKHSRPPSQIFGNATEITLLARQPKKTPEEAIQILSSTFPSILFGLHTPEKAEIWQKNEQLALEATFQVPIIRSTGAGDSWHAGFLAGQQIGLTIPEATTFANAVAGFHLSTGKIVTIMDAVNLSNSSPRQSI